MIHIRKRNCANKYCNKEFELLYSYQKYCCKECAKTIEKESKKRYIENNIEKHKESVKKTKLKNKQKIKNYSKIYYDNHKKEYAERSKKWAEEFKEKNGISIAAFNNKKIRDEIINLLGNKCSNPYNLPHPDWCNDPRCLQIDHINGNGCKERKNNQSIKYLKLILEKIKNGSNDYQLLCANCNWIKVRKNGENSKYANKLWKKL